MFITAQHTLGDGVVVTAANTHGYAKTDRPRLQAVVEVVKHPKVSIFGLSLTATKPTVAADTLVHNRVRYPNR